LHFISGHTGELPTYETIEMEESLSTVKSITGRGGVIK
jgi:hypothetical protein